MRNYDKDIEELYERIEALELEKKQRNKIPAKKQKEKRRPVVKDKEGTIIQLGDWVRATTPGKLNTMRARLKGGKSG